MLDPAFLARPIAHRGLHDIAAGVPENSFAALRAAQAAGLPVELDLQPSADGEPMVFHDDALGRLTGADGPIAETGAPALADLRLLGTDEPIPTFAAFLAAAGDTPLLIELKAQADPGPLAARAAALLADHRGPAAAMSFDPATLAAFAAAAPDVPRGLVSMGVEAWGHVPGLDPARREALARLDALAPLGCAFASFRWQDLPTPATRALRDRGVPVLCWTTRSPAEAAAARPHADAVTFEGAVPAI